MVEVFSTSLIASVAFKRTMQPAQVQREVPIQGIRLRCRQFKMEQAEMTVM